MSDWHLFFSFSFAAARPTAFTPAPASAAKPTTVVRPTTAPEPAPAPVQPTAAAPASGASRGAAAAAAAGASAQGGARGNMGGGAAGSGGGGRGPGNGDGRGGDGFDGDKERTVKGRLKCAQLPIEGKIRYVPPDNYYASMPLPRGPNNGFIDKFGNEWVKGPSRTLGQPFEWDVQLSTLGRQQLGWASNSGQHLNVSPDGKITHR